MHRLAVLPEMHTRPSNAEFQFECFIFQMQLMPFFREGFLRRASLAQQRLRLNPP
jgi:hypothetical protein